MLHRQIHDIGIWLNIVNFVIFDVLDNFQSVSILSWTVGLLFEVSGFVLMSFEKLSI